MPDPQDNANLAAALVATAAEHPDAVAVKLDDVELSYQALEQVTRRVAGFLKAQGVQPGDRVGIMLPNVPHFPLAYFGALRLGAVVVPMNPLLSAREVTYYLQDSGATLLMAWHGFSEAAEPGAQEAGATFVEVEPQEIMQRIGESDALDGVHAADGDDTAVLLYTSGTTGQPKGAELTHANIGSNVTACLGLFSPEPGDVIFGGLPFFHVFGQTCALNTAVRVGATITLVPKFEPGKALEVMGRDKVTVFMGVPTMYGALLHHPDRESTDTSSLRLCASGGSALPVEVLKGFEDAFGCKILEGYGLSETSPVASFNHPHLERKPGSIGIAIEHVEIRLVDDDGAEVPQGERGEIEVRGPNIMKGYWGRPDATAESIDADGWFATGDVATVDEDGFYYIVDRKKDLILRGGYNVYPREIEEVLYEHPAVLEAAVIGIEDEEWGEEVGAAVVLKEGQDVSTEDLQSFVKDQVAKYKYPRRVWFEDELPKGPTGKILKREIRAPDPA